MNKLCKGLAFGASLLLLTGSSSAQELGQARRIQATPKHAGVYHLATRSWTRPGRATLGALPGVLYNNTAPSGYFGPNRASSEINWTDEGRIPSTSGHSNAVNDRYIVQGFQVAYCDTGTPGSLQFRIDFYELYSACTDPRRLTPLFSASASIPGLSSASTSSCWIVNFDLSGTSLEFRIAGDGDASFDGTSSMDNFGWQLHLNDGHGSTAAYGPLLCYDPQGYFGCAAGEGDGTYYQAGSCSSPYGFGNFGSGLSVADRMYTWVPDSTGYLNGCYWFGGYSSSSPLAGFWMVVYGDNPSEIGSQYCTANPNSTGSGGRIAVIGSGSVSEADTVATAVDVPGQPGFFFHGASRDAILFGCGWRCVSGGVRRGAVVVAAGQRASFTYDETTSRRSLAGFENATRHFQYWYRDPMHTSACGNSFNLTNGVSVPIVP